MNLLSSRSLVRHGTRHGLQPSRACQTLILQERHLPVARMTVSASTAFSSVQIMKGRLDRSTLLTVSEKMRVPKRSLCALQAQRNRPSAYRQSWYPSDDHVQGRETKIMANLNLSVRSPPMMPAQDAVASVGILICKCWPRQSTHAGQAARLQGSRENSQHPWLL